jgi:hypothetical protein
MKIAKTFLFRVTFVTMLAVLGLLSPAASAQVAGDNVVYNSATTMTFSNSFIDASVLTGTDVCAKIRTALKNLQNTTNYPAGAAVIDARGITSSSTMTCASGTTPWYDGTTFYPNAAVILLPPGTIAVNTTWLLPNRTRIIGEGAGGNGTAVTTLQAASTLSGTMVQMGTNTSITGAYTQDSYDCPSGICFGIGIEDLRLDGQASTVTVNGILNDASQELTLVNRVDLYNIKGIGLLVGSVSGGISSTVGGNAAAQNSGPYSNIKFENSASVAGATECAQVLGAPTRGLHGLTCSSTSTANAGIVVDASNTSIEDVNISGFGDGIVLGANSAGAGTAETANVLLNISGTPSVNLIHICKPGETGSTNCSSNTSGGSNVADLSILSVYDSASTTDTIADDETGAMLSAASTGDPHVAIYILGRAVTVGTTSAWSRFTTSGHFPTWLVGNGTASGSCTNKGAIYSNTGGTSLATTVYACTGSWTGL